MNHQNFDWTAARVAELTKAWLAGTTAAEIAMKMGDGLTRSSIIGKVNRLGLERDETTRRQMRSAASAKRHLTKAAERERRNASARMKEVLPPPISLPEVAGEPMLEGVSIDKLERHHCRWPIEIPGELLRYCGARKADGARTYCATHAQIAFAPKSHKVVAEADQNPRAKAEVPSSGSRDDAR